MAARFADADIDEFYWVNDERLVFHVTDHTRGGGDQRLWPGLFSVRRDGTGQRMLVRTRPRAEISDERWVGAEPLAPDHVLLHVPVDGGGEVIVGQYQTTQTREPATLVAKRLNIETGRTRNLSDGIPPHVRRWWFTPQGQPRALMTLMARCIGRLRWEQK